MTKLIKQKLKINLETYNENKNHEEVKYLNILFALGDYYIETGSDKIRKLIIDFEKLILEYGSAENEKDKNTYYIRILRSCNMIVNFLNSYLLDVGISMEKEERTDFYVPKVGDIGEVVGWNEYGGRTI